jgi:hypothetical protein
MAEEHPLVTSLDAHLRGQASESEITRAIESFVIDDFLKGDIAATPLHGGEPLEQLVHDWSRQWSEVRPRTTVVCGPTVSLVACTFGPVCQVR